MRKDFNQRFMKTIIETTANEVLTDKDNTRGREQSEDNKHVEVNGKLKLSNLKSC